MSDRDAGYEITDEFEPFSQKYDVFRRSFWDERVRSPKSERFYRTYRETLDQWRRADGFTQRDYALRNASWHVSDLFTEYKEDEDRREGFNDAFTLQRDVAPERVEFDTPAEASSEIKRVARGFGADLVGVTELDPRWLYTEKFSDLSGTARPNDIPEDLGSVIVTAQAMDYELIRTVPSALSGAATGLGYSHDALVVLSLAQYIRNLGYRAIASMNDSALAIPLALQAGLGEYSRLGLLITKEFGPRVRLGKVFTDLPLATDRPIRFGVKEFCEGCGRCAEACPVGAIPSGEPSTERYNESNLKGVRKWSVDGEACFGYWAAQNSDCAICMRVWPYNKDYEKWWARAGRRLAGTRLRGFMLWLDGKLGFGDRVRPRDWWARVTPS
ncbi:MAG: reductive dehalogenase [Gemmatimonadetes bacterium]|nr:reductive dehalogenase [Gemmatimonadota bacterium]